MTSHNPDANDRDLEFSLALMRFAIAGFLMVWVCDKLLNSSRAMQTFTKFYTEISADEAMFAVGVIQLVLVLAFAAGLFKTFTYGAVTLMHAVSTFSSYNVYLDPLARPNILFWAAVPVLAAMIALFILRRRDRLWTLG